MNVYKIYDRPKSFFFHYNKPLSKKSGKPKISMHIDKVCYIVDHLVCDTSTKDRIQKRQPYFVMTGKAKRIEIVDGACKIS